MYLHTSEVFSELFFNFFFNSGAAHCGNVLLHPIGKPLLLAKNKRKCVLQFPKLGDMVPLVYCDPSKIADKWRKIGKLLSFPVSFFFFLDWQGRKIHFYIRFIFVCCW